MPECDTLQKLMTDAEKLRPGLVRRMTTSERRVSVMFVPAVLEDLSHMSDEQLFLRLEFYSSTSDEAQQAVYELRQRNKASKGLDEPKKLKRRTS